MDFTKTLPLLPAFLKQRSLAHHKNLSHEQYAALPALNASVLKCRTALDMLYAMMPNEKEKECFDLGGNLHCAVLEEERWQKSLVVLPDDAPPRPTAKQFNAKHPNKQKPETREAIAWWNDFDAKFAGKTVLPPEDHDQVMEMRKALLRHHKIRSLLEAPGNNETTVEVWDPEWQIMRKARFDRLPGRQMSGNRAVPSFVIDIKTTSANIDSDWAIRSEILKWGYHLQARWYLDILALALDEPPRDRFYFAFVTTKAPYKARLYELNVNTPGDNLLNDAGDILYQSGKHSVGRVPMFIDAAREFLTRVQEGHPDPLGAWTAYEDEDARLVEGASRN